MKRLPVFLALVLTAALGCGDGGGSDPGPSPQSTTPDPPTPSEPAPPAPAPPTAACAVPGGNLVGNASTGAEKYAIFCAPCHGPGGKGDGPAAPAGSNPADHTDRAYMSTLSNEDLYTVIACGGPAVDKSALMAAWGAIIDEQGIKDLIAHLRALSGT